MKRVLTLLLVCIIFLTGSTGIASQNRALPDTGGVGRLEKKPTVSPPKPLPKIEPAVLPAVYEPDSALTIRETVEAYFEQQYNGYLALRYIDVSSIVNTKRASNENMLNWLKIIVMRRRLLAENHLGYVSSERFPYKIVYDSVPEDQRVEMWRDYVRRSRVTVVHFHIEGEKGKVYPPFMAVNSQHTMFLKQYDGAWKIEFHYFPGSVRKFTNAGTILVPTEKIMLEQLQKEFAAVKSPPLPQRPEGALAYDFKKAAGYAEKYTERKNTQFSQLGDWTGDCANFVSQCVWAGFGGGDSMTAQWQSGSAAWVNVNSFWSYISSNQGLKGQPLAGIQALRPGDILQTRTASITSEKGRYTHTLLLVDKEKLILAQNTPGAFVYYSDLANTDVRFVRPVYLVQ